MNIATHTPITPNAIRTQTHHDGPPPESVAAGVVCVTCAVTEVDFVTDVVAAGFVAVWVSAVALADWVLLVSSPVALETAPFAAFAALDAALLADPDPHPLSSAVAMPSASAATTIGRRAVNLTVVSPLIAARVPQRLDGGRRRDLLMLSPSVRQLFSSVATDETETRDATARRLEATVMLSTPSTLGSAPW